MLKRRYTFLLVAIAFLTGMNNQVSKESYDSFEQYLKINKDALVYILSAVSKNSADGVELKKQQNKASDELSAYRFLTQYLHQSSNVFKHTGYNQILLFGIVFLTFFANNSIRKNHIWRSTLF